MASLGFHVQLVEASQTTPELRVYRHEGDGRTLVSSLMERALISVGVACVEMASGIPSTPDNCLSAFDRTNFDSNAQKKQAMQTQAWLMTYLKHLQPA